jgi:hypothetical protein
MKDAKARIMARRSAFIAAAALTASCDRCGSSHPGVCLSVAIQEDSGTVRPHVCLSPPPHACLAMPELDPDATIPDAGKEGGAITLAPIDITTKDASVLPPAPCLTSSPRTCLSMPPPRVCLRRLR